MTLFVLEELNVAQVGYSVSEAGEDFTGSNDGDWKPQWLVIGYEDRCGDPIFVDLSNTALPVFTAPHGQGRWDPELLASTFDGFVLALTEIDLISTDRRNPVELERNPLSSVEKEALLMRIAATTETSNLEFWESWIHA